MAAPQDQRVSIADERMPNSHVGGCRGGRRVCVGHIHPYHRVLRGRRREAVHYVSSGSVGKPKDLRPACGWVELVFRHQWPEARRPATMRRARWAAGTGASGSAPVVHGCHLTQCRGGRSLRRVCHPTLPRRLGPPSGRGRLYASDSSARAMASTSSRRAHQRSVMQQER